MELNERETLVKVEQQLNNSIDNQKMISDELREFMKKLERNDKAMGLLQMDLKTHMNEAPLRREDLKNKLQLIGQDIATLKQKQNDNGKEFQKDIEELEKAIADKIEDLGKKLEDAGGSLNTEKTERGTFETTVKTSVRNFKIFISTIIGFFAFLTVILKIIPMIVELFK